MKNYWIRCCLLGACMGACNVAAADWQDFRLTYLQGNNYRIGDPQRQVITVEHAMASHWGDSFFFLDHMKFHDGTHTNYAELQPRFSIGKRYGWTDTFVKDVLIATQVEMSSQRTNLLYGVGLDLQLPGFKFTQLNLYRRDNEKVADNWQATLVWGLPFSVSGQQFLYDGFIDWASGSPDQHANVNFTSQFKWRMSQLWQGKDAVWLGIEYVWWRDKFGIADSPLLPSHESNVNLLVKWHL